MVLIHSRALNAQRKHNRDWKHNTRLSCNNYFSNKYYNTGDKGALTILKALHYI